jgi:tetratricopeptide (TPR) repeat protein
LARAGRLDTAGLEAPARRAFRDAGDRVLALNAYAAASRLYDRALELWPREDRDLGVLLFRRAYAIFLGGESDTSEGFEESRDALLAVGAREEAARAEIFGALALRNCGRTLEAVARARAAAALLEDLPASEVKTFVAANLARLLVILAESAEGIEIASEALRMARALELRELEANTLNTLGMGRVFRGDVGGIAELEESLEIAVDHGSPFELGRIYNNLEGCYTQVGRIADSTDILRAFIELRERLGLPTAWQRTSLAQNEYLVGRWDEVERLLGDVADEEETEVFHGLEVGLRLARDDLAGAITHADAALAMVREAQQDVETITFLQTFLGLRAELALAEGDERLAQELVDEVLEHDVPLERTYGPWVVWFSLVLEDLGRIGQSSIANIETDVAQPWLAAARAISDRDFRSAAERMVAIGARTLEAAIRFHAAVQLGREGRGDEAEAELQDALSFYRSVGATRYIREGEALLAATA